MKKVKEIATKNWSKDCFFYKEIKFNQKRREDKVKRKRKADIMTKQYKTKQDRTRQTFHSSIKTFISLY